MSLSTRIFALNVRHLMRDRSRLVPFVAHRHEQTPLAGCQRPAFALDVVQQLLITSCQPLMAGFGRGEEDWLEFCSPGASGLGGVAVGAQGDHLERVIVAAQGQVVDVVDLQDRGAVVGAVVDVAGAAGILAMGAFPQAADGDGAPIRSDLYMRR